MIVNKDAAGTMDPNWKSFPLRKLHKIERLKIHMDSTTTGRVDQLWKKEECSSHPKHILGKVKTTSQCCGLRASSGGSLE